MQFDRRLVDRLGIDVPVIQAPMIGPKLDLAAAVSGAGGLGSIGCAAMSADQLRAAVEALRRRTARPFNLNFFCHAPQPVDEAREAAWRARLAPYYAEAGLDPSLTASGPERAPFGEQQCDLVEELGPRVVSFHFGLPKERLLARVKRAGCLVLSSATTVAEARWLAERGVDAVIAQGAEAGGHRGMFLSDDPSAQVGTLALVPQVVDAVSVPVVAAGGIADARGVAAALVLGAAAAQVGSAYLLCPEAGLPAPHLDALRSARDDDTAVTNVFTGRAARGLRNRALRELGPISPEAPAFPRAAVALGPLRAAAEARGSGDFTPLWAGQGIGLAREVGAADLTRALGQGAMALLRGAA